MAITAPLSRKPLYRRIIETIRERIVAGEWKDGDALPPRPVLALEMRTTRSTLEKAINELVREGLLDVARGSGTYVRSKTGRPAQTPLYSVPNPGLRRIGIISQYRPDYDSASDLAAVDPYFGQLFSGLRSALSAGGPSTIFLNLTDGDYDTLLNRDLDGALVIVPTAQGLTILEGLCDRLPMVVVGASPEYAAAQKPLPCVDSANLEGARAAVAHLIDLGHRRIAIVNTWLGSTNFFDRLRGYLMAHNDAGLDVRPSDMILTLAGHERVFEPAIDDLLARPLAEIPTAIFLTELNTALFTLKLLQGRGIGVPRDMSLICFDDNPIAEYTTPPLSTVRQPVADMGRRAAQRLLSRFGNGRVAPDDAGTELVPTQLVLRSSTAAPRSNR